MSAGRPTDYRPEYCELVIELGKAGKSKAQMAARLDVGAPIPGLVTSIDVSRQTLENWADAHPEFLDAMARANVHAMAWWEDEGQDGLRAERFNASLWAKNMSARFPADYRDNSKVELTGRDGGAIEQSLAVRFVEPGAD